MSAMIKSDYTQELADFICGQLADGLSLRTVCQADGMPNKSTVFRWLRTNEAFREQYTRAKEESADALADEMVDIADDRSDDPQSRRVRVDTRKWVASKLKPKRYGDKVEATLTGPNGGPMQHTIEWVSGQAAITK